MGYFMNLPKLLKDGANPALRMLNQDGLCTQLAQIIIDSYNSNESFLLDFSNLSYLIQNYDYRLVAEYLWALKNDKESLLQIFKQMLTTNESTLAGQYLYRLAYQRFKNTQSKNKNPIVLFAKTIDEIFTFKNQGVLIYLYDRSYKEGLISLLEDLGGSLSDFIEEQYDVPGRNAVVRQGIVKSWSLPNGTPIISKRQSPYKADKFHREQLNHHLILEKLSRSSFLLSNPADRNRNIHIQIAHPFALVNDAYAGMTYALFKKAQGIALEEILLEEKNEFARSRHLLHYGQILEELYIRGILWGDMSPRNILVCHQKDVTRYTLFDLEKTFVTDKPIPHNKRTVHCRGQMFIEELCVICPFNEIVKYFKRYFDPSRWDTKSLRSLTFELRPDIVSLLRGRGITNISIGEYNRLDKKIIDIRRPYWNSITKQYVFPGSIGFKVEHYLCCVGDVNASDYDRKTTEVLLAAKEQNCFRQVVDLLLAKANNLESALLKLEFMTILGGGFSGNLPRPQQEVMFLTGTLDNFYQHRHSKSSYSKLIATEIGHKFKENVDYD
ncbi:hypothetical protein COX24_00915 [bacterium (Candidatus Gribaldobacteria) CG23_combo_of_CG06-09_8_20_14_all_37_87_8]|uniref:Protein kinase domain-containing protein n=1 Tax=bacterium (Candidatus Gribaldobacteria) CG23_combo_of_CG06-09_8_20_14_all_37_87_8 TaxID=2014278 RepID=A0A2G9ZFP2_9BACT|nr:MAG: hypothetical protein COX24_00915 [bacterium (Candidatus Gribaldobacteria) CG23_combo_of_CG06-09_8_20_14_all_37_87_8]